MKTRNLLTAGIIVCFVLGVGIETQDSAAPAEPETKVFGTVKPLEEKTEKRTEEEKIEVIEIQAQEQKATEELTEIKTEEKQETPPPIPASVAEEIAYVDAIAEPDVPEEPPLTYVGCYELTAYIATGNPCADGVYPSTGYTAACNDPTLWHKWIHIEGYGDFYVHDTGGMASNVIDLFVGSYDEAIQFGRREAEVYIIGE